MSEISFNQTMQQRQSMSPRLQHACRLLQMPSLEFTQEIARMADTNPFLEFEVVEAEGNEERSENTSVEQYSESHQTVEEGSNWSDLKNKSNQADSDATMLDFVADEAGMRRQLTSELGLLRIDDRMRVLTQCVVDSLDDDGYLRIELADLFSDIGNVVIDQEEIEKAVKIVQSLGPAGIAARSLQECLLLQVENIEDESEQKIARNIISSMLGRLSSRDYVGIARELKVSVGVIEEVCACIRRFNPKPGLMLSESKADFVTPDIIVKKIRGKWIASLNSRAVPRLKVNSAYADLANKKRGGSSQEFLACLQEAKWAVKNIEHRFSTILAVATAIIERQTSFFEYGAMGMKPLGLKEIAEAIGVHESTVSRVTNGKYMATPLGVFELKHFFSRSMPTASGGSCSATALRRLIQELIASENVRKPLSDVEIARNLARQGLPIARRTVTKYRQSMKIRSAEHRRARAM
jgi:RNA polymerase sigma-54 factor